MNNPPPDTVSAAVRQSHEGRDKLASWRYASAPRLSEA